MDSSHIVQKALTGIRWATIFRIIGQIITWASTIFVIRYITPADYGLNGMLEPVILFSLLFSTLGMGAALVQRKYLNDDELKSAFGLLLLVNLAVFAFFFSAAPYIADYYNEPRLEDIARALSAIFIILPFRIIPNALLDRELKFKLKAAVELVSAVVGAITTLILAYLGYGVWALVSGALVNRLLNAILLMIAQPWFLWPQFRISHIKELLSYGGFVTLASALFTLSDMLGAVIAGPILGAGLFGIYAMAGQFALMPLSKGLPIINQTMLPAFSRIQDDTEAVSYYLMRLIGVATLLFVPATVGIAAVSDTLVAAVFGEKWNDAVVPLAIMSLGMTFRLINIFYKTVLNSIGMPKVTTRIAAVQFALSFLFIFFFAEFGVVALSTVWVVVELIIFVIHVTAGKNAFNATWKRLTSKMYPAAFASLVMGAVVVSLHYTPLDNSVLLLLSQVIAGVVVYSLVVWFVFRDQFRIAEKAILGKNCL